MVRVVSKHKAEKRAADIAVLISNSRGDLLHIDPVELAEFRRWKAASQDSPELADACSEFISLKAQKSSRHRESLTRDLLLFEKFIGAGRALATITALDIQRFISSRDAGQRRKFNLRVAVISLFRWARRMSYLPDRTTEAEKVEPIELVPGAVSIIAPDQMRTLLDNVRPEFMPWLCVAAFAGIRSEEIAPDPKSKKSALMWNNFDWNQKVKIACAKQRKPNTSAK